MKKQILLAWFFEILIALLMCVGGILLILLATCVQFSTPFSGNLIIVALVVLMVIGACLSAYSEGVFRKCQRMQGLGAGKLPKKSYKTCAK